MLFGLYSADTTDALGRAGSAPAAELPPSFAERYFAELDAARDYSNSDALWRARHATVQSALDAFESATGETLPNPEAVIGPNRAAVERFNQQRFDQIKADRPDLNLSYPTDEQRQQAAVERAWEAKRSAHAMDARPGSLAGFLGGLAGGAVGAMTDPVNLLSMALGAGPSAGILRTAAVEAAANAGGQAVVEAGTAPFKKQVDPAWGLGDAAESVGMAAVGGAVLGGGVKALGEGLARWRGLPSPSAVARAQDAASKPIDQLDAAARGQLDAGNYDSAGIIAAFARDARAAADQGDPVPREILDALNVTLRDHEVRAANPLGPTATGEAAHFSAMEKAAQDLEAGRPVDVSSIVAEARQIGDGYDRVKDNPNGPADDPLIHIQPGDIESVIIGRGGFKGLGDVEVKGSGWGLVKFIWRHGEGSGKATANQITRDDLVAFPEIIRTREATVETRSDGSVSREWRVNMPGPDGVDRMVIFADGPVSGRQGQHLVTVFVQEPGRARGARAESALKTGPAGSPLEVRSPLRDTDQGVSIPPDGRAGPANVNVSPNASRVYTPGGRAVDVEYRAVEADSLITSHSADGAVNPAFPAEIQPRDRTRVASQAQIADIAANLQPERLGRSPDAASGAPIVGPDMVVESGNGRVGGIRRAYEQGGDAAARYRDWVVGQNPAAEGMRNPVLVAIRKTDLDPAARVEFARDANAATAARLSPTELAMADARRLDDAALSRLTSGDVTAAGNRGFVRAFLDRLPPSERGSLVDGTGALNQEGRKRLEGALLGRAYGDAVTIGKIIEDADSDIRAIGGALLDVAGPWAKLRAAVARGDLPEGMDVTADLLSAVRMVAEARANGRAVSELAQQMGLFGDDLTPTARRLLAGLFRDEALTKPAGRARVAEMLSGYLDEAGKNSAGARLFGEPLTAEQILKGERLTGEAPRPANDAGLPPGRPPSVAARSAEDAARAPEMQDAIYHDLNRVMAARDPDISVGEAVDPETGKLTTVKRRATDLMDEADRDIADVDHMAACVFGVAAE